jgi:hypothetical protein
MYCKYMLIYFNSDLFNFYVEFSIIKIRFLTLLLTFLNISLEINNVTAASNKINALFYNLFTIGNKTLLFFLKECDFKCFIIALIKITLYNMNFWLVYRVFLQSAFYFIDTKALKLVNFYFKRCSKVRKFYKIK